MRPTDQNVEIMNGGVDSKGVPLVASGDVTAVDARGIDQLPSGRWRFRIWHGPKVLSGTSETFEGAVILRDEVRHQISDGGLVPAEGLSLRDLGPRFLASRSGHRDSKTDGSRWHMHVGSASFAAKPLAAVTRGDGVEWLEILRAKRTQYDPEKQGKRKSAPLSWQSRKHCLNLARRAYVWAIDHELTQVNPFADLVIEREDGDEDDGYQETWYLDAVEQRRLLECFDQVEWDKDHDVLRRAERWLVAFAFSTGLRQGEQWCLHLADVHVDGNDPHVLVRFGSWDPDQRTLSTTEGTQG